MIMMHSRVGLIKAKHDVIKTHSGFKIRPGTLDARLLPRDGSGRESPARGIYKWIPSSVPPPLGTSGALKQKISDKSQFNN